jgi:uncharacterized membrane protein YeaQ/YmgE (transglycosylase-associated protein family)
VETGKGVDAWRDNFGPARWDRQRAVFDFRVVPLLFWIIDGLAAGWLTGKIMSSEGHDRVMDTVMGVAGGFLFSATHLLVRGMIIYTNLAAILGAVILTVLSRYVGGRREYGATD